MVQNTTFSTRRRFLYTGAAIFTTTLAGCTTESPEPPDDYTPADYEPFSDELPETPPAIVNAPSGEYSYYDLPDYFDKDEYPNRSNSIHPDNRPFTVEVLNKDAAKATFTQINVVRDIDIALHVCDHNDTFQTVTQTLTATDDDAFETRIVEFDISHITLPRNIGGLCKLTGHDTHEDIPDDFHQRFKRHHFVGVEHKQGTTWVNSEHLNHELHPDTNRYHDTRRGVKWEGRWHNRAATPAGYVEQIDTDDERIVIIVTCASHIDRLLGVSCHIDHDPARNYKNGSDRYQWQYGFQYECHYATQISHFQEFAVKIDQLCTRAAITAPNKRLRTLGDFIQTIPYVEQANDPSPTVVLYDLLGDCSSKSFLMSAILQNDPWNVMPVYIRCTIDDIGHMTIGLNVDDLGPTYTTADAFTVRPSESKINSGIPNAEYAFYDMTYGAAIGERHRDVQGPITVSDEGNFAHTPGRYVTDDPPNY